MNAIRTYTPEILDRIDIAIITKNTVDLTKGSPPGAYIKSMEEIGIPWESNLDVWEAGGGVKTLEFVPVNEEIGLYEPVTGNFRAANSIIRVPWNKTGIYFSMVENWDNHIRKALFDVYGDTNPEIISLIKFLESEGYENPMEIISRGVENMKGAYAKLYFDGKTSILVGNKDVLKLAKALAQKYDMTEEEAVEYVIRNFIYHELGHNQGVVGKYAERFIGKLLKEFYEKKARSSSGEKAGLFRKLAKMNKDYAERFHGYSGLVEKYIQEALEKGYDEEEVMEYVTNKLEEELSEEERSELENKIEEESEESEDSSQEEDEENCEETAQEGSEE